MYARYIKRPMDFVLSLIAIICLSWLFIILAILVRVKLGSPVIFKQQRPGKKDKNGHEKIFTLYKFRTMTDARDADGNLLPDDARLTPFGKWLRSTSLDELPELFNILKGDMSFVGPRPLLVEYLPYYTEEERHRHDIRPGLTGWAQINGRNEITWEEKFSYDLEYVKDCSLILDMKIILTTMTRIIKRSGILVGSQHKVRRLDVERTKEGTVSTDHDRIC